MLDVKLLLNCVLVVSGHVVMVASLVKAATRSFYPWFRCLDWFWLG